MARSPKKWHIIVGVIILVGVAGLYGISINGNHSVSNIYFIPGGTFSPLPQQSVVIQSSPPGELNLSQTTCIPDGHKEYRITPGQPFVYTGRVPDNVTQSAYVFSNTLMNPNPSILQYPVDPYGKFSFRIEGNATQQIWDEYNSGISSIRGEPSPVEHVCIGYFTGTECFDLRVVQDPENLTTPLQNDWIHIDPIVDPVIAEEERNEYTGNFFINGTTNLSRGDQIHLTVESLCFLPCPKTSTPNAIGCCGSNVYESVATVREGSCGTNTWSIFVDTTPNRFIVMKSNEKYGDLNEFLVLVTHVNRTNNDNGWDSTDFVIRVG